MELNSFKVANIRKVNFLILFFIFSLFSLGVFAAESCDLDGWNNEDCTVDIYYEDPTEGSGLDECKYTTTSGVSPSCPTDGSWTDTPNCTPSCSGTSCTCYDIPISIGPAGNCYTNGEGACKICSKATDGAGNVGYGEQSLNIDYKAPETTVECNGTTCSAGWYNADVSIALTCLDSHSGCDKTYYCIDQTSDNPCDPLTEYIGTFNLTAEGTNYVRYSSTDKVGNIEPTNSKTIKLDKTGPKSEFTDVTTPPAGSTVTTDFDVSVDDWDRPLGVDGVDNSSLAGCYYSVYDSGVGWTKSGETRNCNSPLSFTVTVGPSGDCRTVDGTCTVSIYAYDIAGNPGDINTRSFTIAEPGLICNINVPDTGIVNQWIEINVSGSQGAIESVKFSSDNILNGSPDGSWDGPYTWSSSSGNWDAVSKTMKWSFAVTGNYEVWAGVKDSSGLTISCYDTIIITECYPGQTDTCISGQGCSHTITCKPDGSWPDCPIDGCPVNALDSIECPCSGIDGCIESDYYDYPDYGDCDSACNCDIGIAPGQPCAPTIYPNDPRCVGQDQCDSDADCNDGNPCTNNWCERPEDPDSICHSDNVDEGTSCGICKECDGNGNCVNCPDGFNDCGAGCQRCIFGFCQDYSLACDGTLESCECILDVCIDCSEYYDGSCGYQGICHCGPLEKPKVWNCVDGKCQCICQYDESCEEVGECQRDNPEVVLEPFSQPANPGEELTYDVWVINHDLNCDPSIFSLSTGEYCNQPGWICSDLNSLTIDTGQSDLTTLRVTSPSDVSGGNYDISVTAQNTGFPEFFGTGYAIYEIPNQPPDKPVSEGVSWDHCSIQGLSIPTFYWTYSDPEGDPQSAYEIRIDNDSDFSVIDDDEFKCDGEICSGGGSPSFSPLPYEWRNWMNWDNDYWWIVRVKDNHNNWSEEWLDPTQFRTPLHAAPWPEFTPSPSRVSLNQVVTFEDNSKCYTSPGNNEFNCQDLPAASYQWDFDYIAPAFTVDNTTKGNATTAYGDLGNYKVKLRITDDIDTCYSETESVTVTRPLPEWMEIPPF